MGNYFMPVLGGLLIGAAASLQLVLAGRITGISGILAAALFGRPGERAWRWAFLLGLLVSPWIMKALSGGLPVAKIEASHAELVLAGLLVGFGTRLGMGCTSGHGICGLSRRSKRSMAATLVFMGVAMVVVALMRGRL